MMPSAAVDTNILVAGAITGHPRSASKQVVDALFAGQFLLLLSRNTRWRYSGSPPMTPPG